MLSPADPHMSCEADLVHLLLQDSAEELLPLHTDGLHISVVESRQQRPWQAAAGALQAGWVSSADCQSTSLVLLQHKAGTDGSDALQRLASRTFYLANLIMCSTILRLRRREAAVRQQVAAEQAKGLEALVQRCAAASHGLTGRQGTAHHPCADLAPLCTGNRLHVPPS